MIKIYDIVAPSVPQWKMAIEAMRLPLLSMDRCDSECVDGEIELGQADLTLMKKLAKAGSDHRKFLRMLPVIIKLTGPIVWLMQLDTYKVGTTSCGSSKMHCLMKKPFEVSDFSFDALGLTPEWYQEYVDGLNSLRDQYLTCEDEETKKMIWFGVLNSLSIAYNQTRVLSLNYEVLYSIYNARRHHKLGEWHDFCDTIVREIPYFAEIFEIEEKDVKN